MDTTELFEWTPHTAASFLNSHPPKCPACGAGLWQLHDRWEVLTRRGRDVLCQGCFFWAQEWLMELQLGQKGA